MALACRAVAARHAALGIRVLALSRRRGLCASTDGGEEPKATASQAEPLPTPTQRQLYEAAIAVPDKKQQGLQGLGAVLALSGTGILAWHNWATLAAFATWNAFGGGLLAAGAGIVATASGSVGARRSSKKPAPKFKLTLLNDVSRWKADKKELGVLLGDKAWPLPELANAAVEERKQEKAGLTTALEERAKEIKAALKAGEAASRIQARMRPRTFVFDFNVSPQQDVRQGNIRRQLEDLRDIVTFILACASPYDSAVLRLKSPGGGVTDYGLAAAQLLRLRKEKVPLTVCVDNVAASGGYMMASTADKIVAAPFSFVGSIGVISLMPNFAKLFQRAELDVLQFTAGKWKRTVDPFTAPTDEGVAKMKEDILKIHEAFKGHVAETRDVDIESVATGEVFLGLEAKTRGLVDALATSDEVLAEKANVSDVVQVEVSPPKKGLAQLLEGRLEAFEGLVAGLRSWLPPLRGRVALEADDPKLNS